MGEAADEEVVEKSLLEDDVWREETSGRPSPTWQSLRRLPRDSPGGGMWLLSPSLAVERRWEGGW